MNIEVYTEKAFEERLDPQNIDINIDVNSTIGELLSKVHEITSISRFKELKWNGNIERISCTYYYRSEPNFYEITRITNLDDKISTLSKCGKNGELSIIIFEDHGLVN